MKVEVVSKEKIKPSSPTPQTLRTYRLSIVDQLGIMMKVPMVFFFDSPARDGSGTHHDIDNLKRSLAITLSLMYPLAGRISDDRSMIDCDDEGVDFIEARVDKTVSSLVGNPDFEVLRKLIPCTPYTGMVEPFLEDERVLVIQVSRFRCGGTAIGFIISHAIGDASSMNTFMNAWAAVNRHGSPAAAITGGGEFIYDCSTMFPPLRNAAMIDRTSAIMAKSLEGREKYVVQRFIFPPSAIARLRKELEEELKGDGSPSRFEAVAALIWMTVIDAVQMRPDNHTKKHALSTIVNLRNKMKPPLPKTCLGNITLGVSAQWESTEAAPDAASSYCHLLVPKIHRSITAVNDDLARKTYGEGDQMMQVTLAKLEEMVEEGHKKNSYSLFTSSFCGFTFYEADFGWGEPKWMVNVQILRDAVCFMDTKDKGIEAWMGLPKDIMHFLMQNQHFLGYTTPTMIPI